MARPIVASWPHNLAIKVGSCWRKVLALLQQSTVSGEDYFLFKAQLTAQTTTTIWWSRSLQSNNVWLACPLAERWFCMHQPWHSSDPIKALSTYLHAKTWSHPGLSRCPHKAIVDCLILTNSIIHVAVDNKQTSIVHIVCCLKGKSEKIRSDAFRKVKSSHVILKYITLLLLPFWLVR